MTLGYIEFDLNWNDIGKTIYEVAFGILGKKVRTAES